MTGAQRAAYQAEVHERAVVVDDNGVATVTVTLKNVTFEEPLVLATISLPNTQVAFDTIARTEDGGEIKVGLSTTRQGVRLAAIGANANRVCRKLTWSFRISNRVRFSVRDLLLDPSTLGQASRELEYLSRSHVLRIRSAELRLSLWFQNGFVPRRPRALQIADKPLWHGVSCELQPMPEEPLDGELTSVLRHTWRDPVVGRRYVIAFDPPQGVELEQAAQEWKDASSLLDKILGVRRSVDLRAQELQRVLSGNLAAQLEELFASGRPSKELSSSADRRGTPWTSVGFLWDKRGAALKPVYGNFPISHFGRQFTYGEGVAGHAFRFGKEATYAGANPTLLYRPRAMQSEDYGWLVCVPLRYGNTCIGVVSFAGRDDLATDHIDVELHALATNPRAATANAHDAASPLSVLTWRVNCAFWAAVAESTWLSTHDRLSAGACLKSLKTTRQPATSVEPPAPKRTRRKALWASGIGATVIVALIQAGPSWIEKLTALASASKASETKLNSLRTSDDFLNVLKTTHDVNELKTIRKQWADAHIPTPSFDGVKLDRLVLQNAPLDHLNMRSANLSTAYLEHADLTLSELEGANLQNSHLDEANLQGAGLERALLQNAILRGARLCQARLREAQLQGATLDDAFLENADLTDANLTNAHLESARGLNNDQLQKACSDTPLKLPPGIDQPPTCSPVDVR